MIFSCVADGIFLTSSSVTSIKPTMAGMSTYLEPSMALWRSTPSEKCFISDDCDLCALVPFAPDDPWTSSWLCVVPVDPATLWSLSIDLCASVELFALTAELDAPLNELCALGLSALIHLCETLLGDHWTHDFSNVRISPCRCMTCSVESVCPSSNKALHCPSAVLKIAHTAGGHCFITSLSIIITNCHIHSPLIVLAIV